MMINHTNIEPAHMIVEYLSPTMYPKPSTAAPVFTLKTSLALSATSIPQGKILVERTSLHQENVESIKS
jgi:hypothetical protein